MCTWDLADPFVTDADGFVVGLKCAPVHHAATISAWWTGGAGLFPLVADGPESFTADVLVYTRGSDMARETATFVLPDEAPYDYLRGRSWSHTPAMQGGGATD